MIPKSGYRLSEKDHAQTQSKAKWRFKLIRFRFTARCLPSGNVQCRDEALLDGVSVPQRQHPRHVFRLDLGVDENWPVAGVQQFPRPRALFDARESGSLTEAAGERHPFEIDAGIGMTRLHAGLAVMGI